MNGSGLPPAPQPWPPLRVAGIRPWIKFRDVALTIFAWAALGWLLKDLFYMVYDILRAPVLEVTMPLSPDLSPIWSHLWILMALSALLAAGLLLWAMKDRHRLWATRQYPTPRALTLSEQAAWFQLDANAVTALRRFKVMDVQFHEDGSIAGLKGRESAGRVLDTGVLLK